MPTVSRTAVDVHEGFAKLPKLILLQLRSHWRCRRSTARTTSLGCMLAAGWSMAAVQPRRFRC